MIQGWVGTGHAEVSDSWHLHLLAKKGNLMRVLSNKDNIPPGRCPLPAQIQPSPRFSPEEESMPQPREFRAPSSRWQLEIAGRGLGGGGSRPTPAPTQGSSAVCGDQGGPQLGPGSGSWGRPGGFEGCPDRHVPACRGTSGYVSAGANSIMFSK